MFCPVGDPTIINTQNQEELIKSQATRPLTFRKKIPPKESVLLYQSCIRAKFFTRLVLGRFGIFIFLALRVKQANWII